jgi:integrin beta 1
LDCSCDGSENSCLSPYNLELCSDHGACECNRCKCDSAKEEGSALVFSGQHCEIFPGEGGACKILADCVECLAFGSGNEAKKGEGCLHCAHIRYTEENRTTETIREETACEAVNTNGCTFYFSTRNDYSLLIKI